MPTNPCTPPADPLLEAICAAAVQSGASDILLHEGRTPRVRVAGTLAALETPALEGGFFDALWAHCGADQETDFDTGLVFEGLAARFRVNLLHTMGLRAAVLRLIRSDIPDLSALGVPSEVLQAWATSRQGLILVCGPAGSGKSTTLAAMLGWMNVATTRHIVTIEDPIEYAFADGTCVFTQREVGVDTPSFAEGLRRCLRQNPDVILVGEIRDTLVATTALQAAETGHLVLATLHSPDCADTIERLESLYEPAAREAVRRTLSGQLLGVLTQKLLPGENSSLHLATEFFTNIGATRKYIAEGRHTELADFIGSADGKTASPFLASLVDLVRTGRVGEATASSAASNPQELQRILRGVTSASSATRR